MRRMNQEITAQLTKTLQLTEHDAIDGDLASLVDKIMRENPSVYGIIYY